MIESLVRLVSLTPRTVDVDAADGEAAKEGEDDDRVWVPHNKSICPSQGIADYHPDEPGDVLCRLPTAHVVCEVYCLLHLVLF